MVCGVVYRCVAMISLDLSSWIKEVRATSLDNERYTPTGGGPPRMPVPPTARVRPRMPPPCVFGPPRPGIPVPQNNQQKHH
nr:hypothetical protein [Tanacetum cinerariifolium]